MVELQKIRGLKPAVDAVFELVNEGNATLTVKAVRPTCGCTVADFDREIAPGATGTVKAKLDTKDFAGPISKSILVMTDDQGWGQAGYYDGSHTFVPLNAGDTFVLAAGEAMPQVVYLPPDVDLETVVDPITDIVSFTVTEDGDPLTTQSGTININAMPPYDLPGQEALIGDGNSPLTSGNCWKAQSQLNLTSRKVCGCWAWPMPRTAITPAPSPPGNRCSGCWNPDPALTSELTRRSRRPRACWGSLR